MSQRQRVGVEDLEASVAQAATTLRRGLGKDWKVPAGSLRWSCERVVFHLADDLVAYAGQLAARAEDEYLAFRLRMPRGTRPEQLVELLEGMAALQAATLRAAGPGDRGFHPHGTTDAEGFAALGVSEVLLHTHDVAGGLHLRFRPDDDLCARVLGRLAPQLEPHDDPWRLMLWATGRADLPGRTRVRGWRWQAAPGF